MLKFRNNILKLYIIVFFMFAFAPVNYAADTRIGIVNTAKILKEAPQAEAARKKLESEFAPRDAKIVDLQKSIKVLEDKLSKDAAIMSEAARKKQEREIVSRKRDVKRSREEFTEDFNFRRNEEIGKLQKLVSETILSLAKEKKYDIILNESVIYASTQVDITINVLDRLRVIFKQEELKQ
ncbi:MAG: OmpH family outer membrane protein [Gammaproteobacteria bacterium]|nr:OmpH family outer membrane protein [Gammaproteobacteria bacterium]MCW8988875.1 OmpH family outer membrane protein [Gammaproteobacteria bacterium]MCW9031948.1 OmpH family outer membrane protein [Gammaproteobacteria bacterium]